MNWSNVAFMSDLLVVICCPSVKLMLQKETIVLRNSLNLEEN